MSCWWLKYVMRCNLIYLGITTASTLSNSQRLNATASARQTTVTNERICAFNTRHYESRGERAWNRLIPWQPKNVQVNNSVLLRHKTDRPAEKYYSRTISALTHARCCWWVALYDFFFSPSILFSKTPAVLIECAPRWTELTLHTAHIGVQ